MTTIVPIGCTATVYLPKEQDLEWKESNVPIKDTEYMEIVENKEHIEVKLTSGTYHFTRN
jgi:hypothetical protein